MAPLPTDSPIRDLTLSSLELDSRSSPINLAAYLLTLSLPELELLNSSPTPLPSTPNPLSKRNHHLLSNPGPSPSHLLPRKPAPPPSHGSGAVPPTAINMKGIQALFALIGVFFVLVGIWFFFWAKNGGFQWRKTDWEDYKSTVLRRKGPDGKTLSNATKSTRLGGGSVVASGYSDGDGMTELGSSSEAPLSVVKEQRGGGKKGKKAGKGLRGGDGGGGAEKKKAQKQRQQKEERWEGGFDHDVRAYRHEKPARVGGLNRDSDAQFYGTDYSETDPSSLAPAAAGYAHSEPHAHRQSSRQSSPDKPHRHHPQHFPSEQAQQQQQQQQHRPSRRDFSYGQDDTFSTVSSSTTPLPHTNTHHATTTTPPAPARSTRYSSPSKPATNPPRSARLYSGTGSGSGISYTEPLDFSESERERQSQGTKSYHHPIPGLSVAAAGGGPGYRAGRGGRRDSLDDSD